MAKDFGRNLLFSGGSWFVASVVALVAVPITVRGLGENAYGVVALAGAFAGYLAMLDVGLGQGVIRYLSIFVSGGYGRAMRQLLTFVVVWFAVAGALGTVTMWVLAPWLAEGLLKVPPPILDQSVTAFRLGGAAFGLGMIASVFSLVPEAFLRYDLASALSFTLGSATVAGPAALVSLGYGLVPVMWFAVLVAAVACVSWGIASARLVRTVPSEGPELAEYWKEFVRFSFKIGVNTTWSAVQTPTMQLVVGIAGGVAAAAFFQVPLLISNRVNGLLFRLSTVLLPTGSQLVAEGEHGLLLALYEKTSRLFFVLNASVVGCVVVFGEPLLRYWIGPRYAQAGTLAFILLTLAVGLNSASMTASQVNMALGRPGINLAFSLVNSAINLGTVYFLTVGFGIAGTALSGLLAAAVVPFFIHYTHRKVLSVHSWRVFRDSYLRTTVAVIAVMVVASLALRPLASSFTSTLLLLIAMGAACLLACAVAGALTREDVSSAVRALRSALRARPRDTPPGMATEQGGSDG